MYQPPKMGSKKPGSTTARAAANLARRYTLSNPSMPRNGTYKTGYRYMSSSMRQRYGRNGAK